MRQLAIGLAVLGVAFSTAAYSQGRTIEETLVVTDPTVAAEGKWKVGGAVEYWYIQGKLNLYDANNNKSGEADISFSQPGFNLFAGYGDWTLQGTRRSGSGDLDARLNNGTTYNGPTRQTDVEFTLRYLIRGWSSRVMTPYVLLGYTSTEYQQDYTLTSGGTWFCSGTANLSTKYQFKGPEAGLGGIFPFTERFGMRVDGRLAYYSGSRKSGNCAETTDNGLGGAATLTGYVNLPANFNLQVGGKFTYLNGGSSVGYWGRVGVFGMLGYSHTF